jgi:hypothetical protein
VRRLFNHSLFIGHGQISMLRLLMMTLAGLITAALLVSTSLGAEPAIKVDDAITAEATSSTGATVTFHVKAYDPDTNNAISASCNPGGSGSGDFDVIAPYPVGQTTVVCTGTLENGQPAESESITVTVQDTTPPALGSVSDITESTTDPAGKQITYTSPTATDLVDGPVTPTCLPASGSTFPVGTTQVSCTATDSHGNSATVNFDVTVTFSDSEAPVFTQNPLPSINVDTSGSSAVVTFSVAANDNSGNAPVVSCNPPSGSTFPVGTTQVNCTASDGTNTASASFSVIVTFVDTVGPVLSGLSSNLTVEANGPSGSIVNYPSPAANDAAEGPKVVTCAPASGTTFALGTTTVTCSAADSLGNTGTASFTISVVDRIAPTLIVPRDRPVYADTLDGISRESHYVALFLSEARAGDTVDPNPIVWNNAPEFLTVGTHVVTFFARDASGNSVSKSAVLEVLPLPPPGTPPLPVPPARSAPPDVRALKAEAGDRRVRLTWQMPNGVDHVVITRTLTAGGDPQVVYTGSAQVLTDRGVANDLEYRYLVVSVNRDGETSAGVAVVAAPKRTLLKSPKDGAKLKKAPKLIWLKNAEASYYNVQLFRGSVKILSVWPLRPNFLVKKSWRYQGRAYKLTPGLYRWYVWPGFGKRSAVDYGGLLGFSTFQIVR